MAKSPRQPGGIVETADLGDWLKVPSDLIASLGDPAVQTPMDVMRYLERQGLTGTLLYRRLKADPDFEAKLRR